MAMAMMLAGCAGTSNPSPNPGTATPEAKGPVSIVASINQWGSLASRIGGNDVTVTSLVTASSTDAHDFEPTSKDLAALSKADIVLVNGAGYDSWATKATRDGTTISAADMVGAIPGDNPHLWFSNDARQAVAKELHDTLCRLRPDDKKVFDTAYHAWQDDEDKLADTMKQFAKDHPDLTYAAVENIAAYLLSDLGIRNLTPKGFEQAAQSDSEPSASDIKDFQQLIDDHGIDLLVNNPQEHSETAKLLVEAANHDPDNPVAVLDVTEQIPADEPDVTAWISSLVKQVERLLSPEIEDCEASGESKNDDGDTDAARHCGEKATSDGDAQSDEATPSTPEQK
ncbi:metal ABC transporter solute-binding protein, Zn/Mn family [Bifidobacterium gallicum]|uniref:ABC transporter, substrate-binding protein n=2 Tax=Bifidobacterium gallicum DSM 20093 = LMG 11596 TaxID=561180 RepID=D1NWU6_9BIFI|nr:zinc ABC transporter substrate-binding protein [Bifidobacterium gallicum]EFA22155.1 ABC transporter, substrate-binding protein [Bifidobacterium gallicum DSM 20093 = LMG 11596]